MVIHINLQSAEDTQLRLLNEGVQELNKTLSSAGMNPAVLVSKSGDLCVEADDGELTDLTVDSLATLLRSVCIPGRLKKNDSADTEEPEAVFVEEPCLPRPLIRSYMETRRWTGVPRIKQVARAPIIRPDFTVRWEPGWDEATQCWVRQGLPEDRRLVERTGEDSFDIRQIFEQFPFADKRLVADALAAALTPLLSTAINSALPALIVAARKPGSGKTELAKFCSIIGNGGKTFTNWRGASELEKMVQTFVSEDNRVVIFDNIKSDIDSTIMESVITSRSISFRQMYSHRSITLRSNTFWSMTSNGAIVSPDMVRRSIVVMLDKDAYPAGWDGTWPAKVEKGENALVTFMCHLIEQWRIAGCPKGSVEFSNFEEWSGVVSGILECAGIGGMWEAREQVVDDAIQTEDEDELPVVEAIAAVMGDAEWTAGQLWEAINDMDGVVFGGAKALLIREWLKTTSKMRKVGSKPGIPTGRALHSIDGKIITGCNIVLSSRNLNGKKLYSCRTLDGTELPKASIPNHNSVDL